MIFKNILLVTFLLIVQQAGTSQQRNCNYSGLEFKQLEKNTRSGQEFTDMVMQSMGGSGLPPFPGEVFRNQQDQKIARPSIESVYILCDGENHLKGQVYYRDLESGFLTIEVTSASHQNIPNISIDTIRVSGTSSEFELTLLDEKVTNSIYSSYLKVTYFRNSVGRNGRSEWFPLFKKWTKAANSTQSTALLRLVPFMTAEKLVNLKNGQQLPIPNQASSGSAGITPAPAGIRLARIEEDTLIVTQNTEKAPQGPNFNNYFSLYHSIRMDDNLREPEQFSPIQTAFLYWDKNQLADVVYYSPVRYTNSWNEINGFDFIMQYATASGPDEEGRVNMSLGLSSGVSNQEHRIIQSLINAKFKRANTIELRPILLESPRVTLQSDGFVLDRISAVPPSTVYSPIRLSWQSDVLEANDVIAALSNNAGLSGQISYHSSGTGGQMDARIRFMDPSVFSELSPDMDRWTLDGWQNPLPFPISLKKLHILMTDPKHPVSQDPIVYTWDIEGQNLLSKQYAIFDANQFPEHIHEHAGFLKSWFDYQILPCSSCMEEVLNEVTSGTASAREKWVRVHALNILNRYSAKLIKVNLRSAQVDPRGRQVRTTSTSIMRDNENFSVGPLYSWSDHTLSYEFQLVLIDGDKEIAGNWLSERSQEIYITRDLMRRAFGSRIRHPN